MIYDCSRLPKDWLESPGPFPSAFNIIEPEALTNHKKRASRAYFERLCLSWNDFEEAGFAAKELRSWPPSKYIQPKQDFAPNHPQYYRVRQDQRLKGCVETTMVIAYARPFSAGRAGSPLGFSPIGLKPKDSTNALHERIVAARDTLFAHSDPQHRRFLWPSFFTLEGSDGTEFERLSAPIFRLGGFFDHKEAHQIELMVFEILKAIRKVMIVIGELLDPPLTRDLPASFDDPLSE